MLDAFGVQVADVSEALSTHTYLLFLDCVVALSVALTAFKLCT